MLREKNKVQLILLFVFIQLLLVGFFLTSEGNPFRPDSERYFQLSKSICENTNFHGPNIRYRTGELRVTGSKESYDGAKNLQEQVPEVFRTPGYPVFLCALDSIGLSSPYTKIVVQYGLFLLSLFFIHRLLTKIDNPKTASLLVLLMLATPGGLIYSLTLYSEILFLLFFSAALLNCFFYIKRQALSSLILSSVLFAIAFYIKPSVLYLPLLIMLVFFVFYRQLGKQVILHGAFFVSLFIMGIAPWLVRNQIHYQSPYISGQMSNMLAVYHLPDVWEQTRDIPVTDARLEARKAVDQKILEEEYRQKKYLNSVEIFKLQQQYAQDQLKEHPVEYAKLWMYGIIKTLKGDYTSRLYVLFTDEDIPWGNTGHASDSSTVNGSNTKFIIQQIAKSSVKGEELLWLAICAFSAVALLVGIWKADPVCLISAIIIAYFVFIPGSMGYSRFRFPIEWLLLWHAIGGFKLLATMIKRRNSNHVKIPDAA